MLRSFIFVAGLVALLVPSLARAQARPSPDVLSVAEQSWRCAVERGEVRSPVVTIIDYSLPSGSPRLWVIDMEEDEVLISERVTHGSGSGDVFATRFSNTVGSRQTPLGVFRTGGVFRGRRGRSLRLTGLERGINHLAGRRGIILHGAPYASALQLKLEGALGLSWGCPAVDPDVSDRVIDTIRGGTLLVVYADDPAWLSRSTYLDCGPRPPG